MKTIEILPFGTDVLIGERIEGKVRAITIGPGNTVFYQVSFWSGNSHTVEDMHESEVIPKTSDRLKIGFTQ